MQSPAFSSLPEQVSGQNVGSVHERLLLPASNSLCSGAAAHDTNRRTGHNRTGRQRDVGVVGSETLRMLTRMLPKI